MCAQGRLQKILKWTSLLWAVSAIAVGWLLLAHNGWKP
jgi:hypothetical protein